MRRIPRWTSGRRFSTLAAMSKTSKAAEAGKSAGAELPFEDALKRLEAIVESMEGDELPLEMLLAKFEEGTRLAQLCQARLAEAELKVQQLEKNLAGQMLLKPVSLSAEAEA